MIKGLRSAPHVYLQLALFNDSVHWVGTLGCEQKKADGLLSACIRTFRASHAISGAFFDADEQRTTAVEHAYEGGPRIKLQRSENVVVVQCKAGHILACVDISCSAGDQRWLGLFTRARTANCDAFKLMPALVLAVQILGLASDSLADQMNYVWNILLKLYEVQRQAHNCSAKEALQYTVQFLLALSRGPEHCTSNLTYAHSIVKPLTEIHESVSAACLLHTSTESSLESCVRVLQVEGTSLKCAQVLAWRYQALICKRSRLAMFADTEVRRTIEMKGDVVLRAWFSLFAFIVCVLFSQSAQSRVAAVSDLNTIESAVRAMLCDMLALALCVRHTVHVSAIEGKRYKIVQSAVATSVHSCELIN